MNPISFYEKVYEVVRQIPYGRVSTYGAIAESLGTKGSSRMVGYAMNVSGTANPPVPAHRVVNRQGLLTGKKSFPTTSLMGEMLKSEGIEVKDDQVVNFKDIFWNPLNHYEMGKLVTEFNDYRSRMNDRVMETANTNIKRFFALDTTSYAEGALDVKTKEMLGLVASMVLRCDDCIKYHLGKCHEAGVNTAELNEVFMIANLVGGSIVIPHYRRAVEYWDELNA